MLKYLLYNKLKFAAVLCAKTLSIFAMIALAFCSSFILQWALMGNDLSALLAIIGWIALIIVGYFVFNFFNYRLTVYYAIGSINRLRKDFMTRLYDMPYHKVAGNDSGYYISMMSKDISIVEDQYFSGMFTIYENVLLAVGSIIAVTVIHWSLALIMVGLSILLLIVPLAFGKMLEKRTNHLSSENGRYVGKLKSILLGCAVIYAYKAKKFYIKQLDDSSDALANASKRQSFSNSMMSLAAQTIVNLVQISLIIYGGFLIYKKTILAGELIALMSLVTMFYNPLVNLGGVMAMVQSTKHVRDKFLAVIDAPKESSEVALSEKRNLVISDLRFSYAEREILKGISMSIEQGEKVLVVGESGSGKSTLVKLIANLLPLGGGSISLGGEPYGKLGFEQINGLFSYVQQDSYIFNDTLAHNIVLNDACDKDRLVQACAFCNIDAMIARLEYGIETVIDEELNQLSGGEKSRINLARAIYANRPILLLDEVTSSLDKANSREIEERLLALPEKTVIIVSHKISGDILERFDKIVLMQDGRIEFMGGYADVEKTLAMRKYIHFGVTDDTIKEAEKPSSHIVAVEKTGNSESEIV